MKKTPEQYKKERYQAEYHRVTRLGYPLELKHFCLDKEKFRYRAILINSNALGSVGFTDIDLIDNEWIQFHGLDKSIYLKFSDLISFEFVSQRLEFAKDLVKRQENDNKPNS